MSTERRLLSRPLVAVGDMVALDEQAARHAAVLRLKVGAEVTLFDGEGKRARATLLAVEPRYELRLEAVEVETSSHAKLVLIQCLPKGGKLDDLVRGATELGVDEIRLATSDHTVAKADERWERKRDRLLRIAEEAARQSERDALPELFAPRPLLTHAEELEPALLRLSLCGRTGSPLRSTQERGGIAIVIGPEGGLSNRELEALDGLGFRRTTLATTILRVETASIAALAVARHLLLGDGDR